MHYVRTASHDHCQLSTVNCQLSVRILYFLYLFYLIPKATNKVPSHWYPVDHTTTIVLSLEHLRVGIY